jgi:hypothetical protein
MRIDPFLVRHERVHTTHHIITVVLKCGEILLCWLLVPLLPLAREPVNDVGRAPEFDISGIRQCCDSFGIPLGRREVVGTLPGCIRAIGALPIRPLYLEKP